jgi:pyrimidine operon attenuation protein / uracil phosphoribosyltransferase
MRKKIIDAKRFKIVLEELAEKLVAEHKAELKGKSVGIVGIHTRGVVLARRLTELLQKKYKFKVAAGSLDITLYRDDVGEIGKQPLVRETNIPFEVEGTSILLIDDVLYTGRTIRSALDALLELGRPKRIRLVVMVDREGRELPIQADLSGVQMDVLENEKIQIKVKEIDGEDGVWIETNKR